jgi:ribosomal protein L14E/L6E/L27E
VKPDINYVLVSDGDLRRVEKAKKKKVKHLKFSSIIIDSISQKTNCGIKLTNAEIRKALTDIKDNEEKK